MVSEAKVYRSFETRELAGGGVEVLPRTPAGRKFWLWLLVFVVTFLISWPTYIFAFGLTLPISVASIVLSPIPLLALMVVTAVGSAGWFVRKMTQPVSVTQDGIIAKNILYRFADISAIGVDNADIGTLHNTSTASGSIGYSIGKVAWHIYILHGQKRIPIFLGMKPDEANALREELVRICSRLGHNTP